VKAEVEEANRQLKLGEEPKPVPDIGFRVLRIDSSNIEDTYRTPGDTDQMDLLSLADNVKLDRSTEDLLFEVLPKFRIPYSARIERRELGGRECFLVDGNRLVACFDTEVGTDTIEEMAKLEPDYAVMRDASMKDDATQANFEELFKTYSPDTVRRVI
jgi:adenine-specific DNA-methyltransferase